jgi:hypothetical protein
MLQASVPACFPSCSFACLRRGNADSRCPPDARPREMPKKSALLQVVTTVGVVNA